MHISRTLLHGDGGSVSSSSSKHAAGAITERSPLIPPRLPYASSSSAEQSAAARGRSGRAPALAPHLEVPEILIEAELDVAAAAAAVAAGVVADELVVNGDGDDELMMLEYAAATTGRPSCESGYNEQLTLDDDVIDDIDDDDDDQVSHSIGRRMTM